MVGRARASTGPGELAALRALPLETWAPGDHDLFIRIHPQLVSGRRIPATSARAV